MTTTPAAKEETLERNCLMCNAVRRVIAKVGPLEIKEPCPNACKGGYFQPPGRTIRKLRPSGERRSKSDATNNNTR